MFHTLALAARPGARRASARRPRPGPRDSEEEEEERRRRRRRRSARANDLSPSSFLTSLV